MPAGRQTALPSALYEFDRPGHGCVETPRLSNSLPVPWRWRRPRPDLGDARHPSTGFLRLRPRCSQEAAIAIVHADRMAAASGRGYAGYDKLAGVPDCRPPRRPRARPAGPDCFPVGIAPKMPMEPVSVEVRHNAIRIGRASTAGGAPQTTTICRIQLQHAAG